MKTKLVKTASVFLSAMLVSSSSVLPAAPVYARKAEQTLSGSRTFIHAGMLDGILKELTPEDANRLALDYLNGITGEYDTLSEEDKAIVLEEIARIRSNDPSFPVLEVSTEQEQPAAQMSPVEEMPIEPDQSSESSASQTQSSAEEMKDESPEEIESSDSSDSSSSASDTSKESSAGSSSSEKDSPEEKSEQPSKASEKKSDQSSKEKSAASEKETSESKSEDSSSKPASESETAFETESGSESESVLTGSQAGMGSDKQRFTDFTELRKSSPVFKKQDSLPETDAPQLPVISDSVRTESGASDRTSKGSESKSISLETETSSASAQSEQPESAAEVFDVLSADKTVKTAPDKAEDSFSDKDSSVESEESFAQSGIEDTEEQAFEEFSEEERPSEESMEEEQSDDDESMKSDDDSDKDSSSESSEDSSEKEDSSDKESSDRDHSSDQSSSSSDKNDSSESSSDKESSQKPSLPDTPSLPDLPSKPGDDSSSSSGDSSDDSTSSSRPSSKPDEPSLPDAPTLPVVPKPDDTDKDSSGSSSSSEDSKSSDSSSSSKVEDSEANVSPASPAEPSPEAGPNVPMQTSITVRKVSNRENRRLKAAGLGEYNLLPDFTNASAWRQSRSPYNTPSLWGQCTWFAWGRFYELYGFAPGFSGNGYECVGQLLAVHGDQFELSKTPKTGAVFSSDVAHNHVGIVLDYDEKNDVLMIQEGNIDGYSNPEWEVAIEDYRTIKLSSADLRTLYGNVTYAVPKKGVQYVTGAGTTLKSNTKKMTVRFRSLSDLSLQRIQSKILTPQFKMIRRNKND